MVYGTLGTVLIASTCSVGAALFLLTAHAREVAVDAAAADVDVHRGLASLGLVRASAGWMSVESSPTLAPDGTRGMAVTLSESSAIDPAPATSTPAPAPAPARAGTSGAGVPGGPRPSTMVWHERWDSAQLLAGSMAVTTERDAWALAAVSPVGGGSSLHVWQENRDLSSILDGGREPGRSLEDATHPDHPDVGSTHRRGPQEGGGVGAWLAARRAGAGTFVRYFSTGLIGKRPAEGSAPVDGSGFMSHPRDPRVFEWRGRLHIAFVAYWQGPPRQRHGIVFADSSELVRVDPSALPSDETEAPASAWTVHMSIRGHHSPRVAAMGGDLICLCFPGNPEAPATGARGVFFRSQDLLEWTPAELGAEAPPIHLNAELIYDGGLWVASSHVDDPGSILVLFWDETQAEWTPVRGGLLESDRMRPWSRLWFATVPEAPGEPELVFTDEAGALQLRRLRK